MLPLPSFGKKHAAVLLLGAAAVAAGWSLADRVTNPASGPTSDQGAVSAPVPKPVTMEDYRSAVAKASRLFAVGDASAASALLASLETIRVPREGMAAHQELVTAVAAYRDALAAGDEASAAAALSRLRSFSQGNPWCGLQF
jgi:hypothetical protein